MSIVSLRSGQYSQFRESYHLRSSPPTDESGPPKVHVCARVWQSCENVYQASLQIIYQNTYIPQTWCTVCMQFFLLKSTWPSLCMYPMSFLLLTGVSVSVYRFDSRWHTNDQHGQWQRCCNWPSTSLWLLRSLYGLLGQVYIALLLCNVALHCFTFFLISCIIFYTLPHQLYALM